MLLTKSRLHRITHMELRLRFCFFRPVQTGSWIVVQTCICFCCQDTFPSPSRQLFFWVHDIQCDTHSCIAFVNTYNLCVQFTSLPQFLTVVELRFAPECRLGTSESCH